VNLKELKEKFKKALLDARGICDEVDKAERDFSVEERTKLSGHLEEAGKLKKQIVELEGDAEMRKQILAIGEGLDLGGKGEGGGGTQSPPGRGPSAGSGRGPSAGSERGKTIGQRFVESEAIQAWLKHVGPSGRIPESAKGLISPPVEFKDLLTGVSDTSAGAFVQTDYTGIYEALGRQLLTLRQMISLRQTTSDLVEFVRQTQIVQEAAPVPEANVNDYAGATGEVSGEKPEGATAFEKVTAAVKTIAVWIPATKRALSDASQIRGIIDQELREDLEEELEDQLINGNGVGENFTGILNTAGILAQAWNTDILTTSRQAKTTLQVTGRARPTAWLINPSDWETIELLQDANNRYYWGGPLSNGAPRLWGVPIIESETIAQGTGLLGDFRKAILWDRERASIQVSDSHADFFIRNMVAILAEMRAAFGLIRPSAFIAVDFESGS